MIKSGDVKLEVKKAQDIVNDPNASIEDKLKAVVKLQEVALKVALGTRLNVVKIMEKLEIEKVKPQVSNENKN